MYNLTNNRTYLIAKEFIQKNYELILKLPDKEKYNLTDQLRRASSSISLNIAEGSAKTNKESINYLSRALGSTRECSDALLQCKTLKYISEEEHQRQEEQSVILQKMLYKFMKALEKNNG